MVPHGTKGTGPGFITRPVYLRSQLRNNTNTVSILILLIHLLHVLCTRYTGIAHHRALQTSGQGWLTPRQYMEWNVAGCTRSTGDPSQQGLLPEMYHTGSTGRCVHLHDRMPNKPTNYQQRNRPQVLGPGGVYSW